MNTIRSTWYGWAAFILTGGGAYYFAKKAINADRAEKHKTYLERLQLQKSIEESAMKQSSPPAGGRQPAPDFAASPSQEASTDPAPTRHAPETEGQRVKEKGKYEASEPYKPKKGSRLS